MVVSPVTGLERHSVLQNLPGQIREVREDRTNRLSECVVHQRGLDQPGRNTEAANGRDILGRKWRA
jgi:hypothetical protein